jgi:hypothetical protein
MTASIPGNWFHLPMSPARSVPPQTIRLRTWIGHIIRHPLGTASTTRDSSWGGGVTRAQRGDGVRAESVRGRALHWRTTCRMKPRSPLVGLRALLDMPCADSSSATVLVSRPWWHQPQESHR